MVGWTTEPYLALIRRTFWKLGISRLFRVVVREQLANGCNMLDLHKSGRKLRAWAWRLICLSLFAGAGGLLCHGVSQDVGSSKSSEVPTEQTTKSSEPQAADAASQSPKATESETKSDTNKKNKSTHRGAIVAAPLPIVSPALGAGIIPVLGYIFPLSAKDKIS